MLCVVKKQNKNQLTVMNVDDTHSYLVMLPQRLSVRHCEQGDAHLCIKENTVWYSTSNQINIKTTGCQSLRHQLVINEFIQKLIFFIII